MDRPSGDRPRRIAASVPSPDQIDNRSTSAPVVTAYCARPQCRKEFRKTMGRGRPRTYCSDKCRREAENDVRRISAQIQHHREMADMLSRDLAAFNINTDETAAPPAADISPELSAAVARAEGVLIGLADGSVLANEFERLLDAIRAGPDSSATDQYRAG